MVSESETSGTFKIFVHGHGECIFKHITDSFSLLVEPVDGVFPIAYMLGENLLISTTSLSAVFNTDNIDESNIERYWHEHNANTVSAMKGNVNVN
jgi:hypothetical protein